MNADASSQSDSGKKRNWESANAIAIYVYSVGLFGLIALSSINAYGISLGWAQMLGLGFVLVLLLFRYFDFIKLGNFLELKRELGNIKEEQAEFQESTIATVEDIKEKALGPQIGITQTNASKAESTIPFEEKESICLKLLKHPKFKWRTRSTLIRKSKMTDEEFEEFLENNPEVLLSPVPDVYGNQLYGLESRVRMRKEYI